jgi:hypothetical protein
VVYAVGALALSNADPCAAVLAGFLIPWKLLSYHLAAALNAYFLPGFKASFSSSPD